MEQYGPISGQQIVNNFYSCKPCDIRRVFLFWIMAELVVERIVHIWEDDSGTYRYAKPNT